MVDVVLYSLAEALSDLQLRHQNSLFSPNVVLFRGPEQASSSETEAGEDPVRERVNSYFDTLCFHPSMMKNIMYL